MATIRDVAQLAGVGVATASRVISGTGSFSAAAAERVRAAAAELGFRPSNVARALSLQSTGTIGVYVPDFRGPFYGPMLDAIDGELRRHGRHMVAVNGIGDVDARQQALSSAEFLADRECDGIIIASNELRDADYLAIRQRIKHVAIINREVKGMKTQSFTVNHRLGGALAARALLEHGHKRLAVISGLAHAQDNRQRLEGFLETVRAAGIDSDTIPVVHADFTAPGGWAATEELLGRKTKFTGLFCANDQMAMAAISKLGVAGKSVPEDVSVVGYDNTDMGAYLRPRLTTVDTHIGEMGLNACRLLVNQCYGKELSIARDFPPTFVPRDSLRKIGR
ncbi:substrate-binding domain-containing protein [Piscinibacter gummiphilus]|uniref:substrate-binding domain-containing protein n=1 Tax=Piscinibacter gummiphilus TaxID=946333 RepID=UPI000A26BBBC|nr:substrate-binding domain-containing protein [Piscinibacter gummiphilus]ATU65695.1 LacI family transcriptional regulator [Piscinibacter gummiphilus]GLS93558.1 transcriptional regulator [Piscinibacter gummiphilus]